MALNRELIIGANKNLIEKMIKNNWKITYDKKIDQLIIGTKFPKETTSTYLDEQEGVLIRINKNSEIFGFIIENYKSVFLKESDQGYFFWILLMPFTYRFGKIFQFIMLMPFMISSGVKIFKEKLSSLNNDLYGNIVKEIEKKGKVCLC